VKRRRWLQTRIKRRDQLIAMCARNGDRSGRCARTGFDLHIAISWITTLDLVEASGDVSLAAE